jgi:hypothetical protein
MRLSGFSRGVALGGKVRDADTVMVSMDDHNVTETLTDARQGRAHRVPIQTQTARARL